MEPLAEALGDQRRLGQLAGYMSVCLRRQGNFDESLAAAQRALAIATILGDVGLQVAANSFLGELYMWALSDYGQAAAVCKWNVELLHGAPLRERFGTTTIQAVHSRYLLTLCLAELGACAEGRAHGEDALQLAEMVEHPYSLAWACVGVGHCCLRQGALCQAIRVLERGLTLSAAMDLPLSLYECTARFGIAYALSGRVLEALPLLERTLEQIDAMRPTYPRVAVWRGEGYMLAGRLTEAMSLGQRALETARAHKQQGYQAYTRLLLGDIAARCEPPGARQADTYYHQALALAEALGMRPLQAHCHYGLGTLYATVGQREQARTALTTAIELYRAMAMAFWLPQAEAVLARVDAR